VRNRDVFRQGAIVSNPRPNTPRGEGQGGVGTSRGDPPDVPPLFRGGSFRVSRSSPLLTSDEPAVSGRRSESRAFAARGWPRLGTPSTIDEPRLAGERVRISWPRYSAGLASFGSVDADLQQGHDRCATVAGGRCRRSDGHRCLHGDFRLVQTCSATAVRQVSSIGDSGRSRPPPSTALVPAELRSDTIPTSRRKEGLLPEPAELIESYEAWTSVNHRRSQLVHQRARRLQAGRASF